MSSTPSERRLAAILSADVVGYSRLMAEDEDATVRRLSAYRTEITNLVGEHRGRVVDFTGDNFLAEFPTATDAVEAAAEIQRVIKARNAGVPAGGAMEFRIGIHVGEVRVEGERLYGDGVNIASRLEGLAEPGGVCVSGTVLEQIRRKLELAFDDLGEQTVKNIPDPVHAYRVREQAADARTQPSRGAGWMALAVGVAIALGVGSWWFGGRDDRVTSPGPVPEVPPGDEAFTVPGFGGAPAIAVLPFDNLSGDPDQEYFADGLAEDLITRLSAMRIFPVIARNSSFTYKGKAVDVKRVGRELGVRYVVEGSVRRADDRVRISAQLIDAATGAHVWADQFDRELKDIFRIQDEITSMIAAALGANLGDPRSQSALRTQPRDVTAYDLYMRGMWRLWTILDEGWDPSTIAEIRALFERAIEIDPGFAPAFAGLAKTHLYDWFGGWGARAESLTKAEQAARRSVTLDPQLAQAHSTLALVLQVRGERDGMLAAGRLAVELDPSSSEACRMLGFFLAEAGRADEADAVLDRCLRLSPRDPYLSEILRAKSRAAFAAGRYAEAAEWAMRSTQQGKELYVAWLDLAASLARAGRLDEARSALEQANARTTFRVTATYLEEIYSYIDDDFLDRWLEGLRMAGLPEE